ncbi:MAG: hypothetical protein MK116_11085 [Phycisphaerales bacterium]|nr:hypothetical protein [Phycisphaerales bacterium]
MADTSTVQLRHELPDGSWHIDWMLARDETSKLVTLRLPGRLDRLETGSTVEGDFLDHHRRRYLQYEGPLSDNRGHVQRVAAGQVLDWACHGDEWWITVQWQDGPRQDIRVHGDGGVPVPGANCRVYCVSSSEDPGSCRVR